MERELNEKEIQLKRENISVGGMPTDDYYNKEQTDELLSYKADKSEIPTVPTKVSELQNDSGYINTETDPVFSQSVASGITNNDISNWNNKLDENDLKTINNESIVGTGDINIPIPVPYYLGLMSDHSSLSTAYDITDLDVGVYTFVDGATRVRLKATYNGNVIQGSYMPDNSINLDRQVYLILTKKVSDVTTDGTTIGYMTSTDINESQKYIKMSYVTVKISSNEIGLGSGSNYTLNVMTRDGAQTITGVKTFSALPESSVTPTTNNQLTNKKYVDDLVGDISTVLATLTTV